MIEDKSRLSDEEIDELLKGTDLEGWRRDGTFLKKDFVFANFREINVFLPFMSAVIVGQNHHPDIAFLSGQKKVSMEMTTHAVGGLTRSDIHLARALNRWRPS